MDRKRLLMIGIVALAVAGFASYAVYRVLSISLSAASHNAAQPAVVAANDLSVGQRLEEKDLRLVKLPASDLPSGYHTTTSELVGRGVVLPMGKNELVLDTKIASDKSGSGLPALIPEGMRAVSVKVNDVISVAGFVVPGTRVDVLLTGNPTRDNDPGNTQTTTVLQNVQVLAAGQKLQRSDKGEAETVPVITLMVSPEDAQKLALASSEGRIQLSLRNPIDTQKERQPSVRNVALYNTPEAKKPVPHKVAKKETPIPPPSAAYTVEMIRGDKREEAKF